MVHMLIWLPEKENLEYSEWFVRCNCFIQKQKYPTLSQDCMWLERLLAEYIELGSNVMDHSLSHYVRHSSRTKIETEMRKKGLQNVFKFMPSSLFTCSLCEETVSHILSCVLLQGQDKMSCNFCKWNDGKWCHFLSLHKDSDKHLWCDLSCLICCELNKGCRNTDSNNLIVFWDEFIKKN